MKKIQLIQILVIALLLPISGNAGEKDVYVTNTMENPVPIQGEVQITNSSLNVNVENTPMVEVVNTQPMPTVVNNTSGNPIPVTLNGGNNSTFESAYISLGGSETPNISFLMNVPPNKTFLMKDIVATTGNPSYPNPWLYILENDDVKISLRFDFREVVEAKSIHFHAGIPFASGSNINIQKRTDRPFVDVLISGLLIDEE